MVSDVGAGTSKAHMDLERLYRRGGAFLQTAQRTRTPLLLTDATGDEDAIIFANGSFLAFFGYSPEDVLGHELEDICDTESREVLNVLRSNLADSIENPQEIVLRRKDGTPTITSAVMLPLADADGAVLYHFLSFIDRTAEHRVKELLIENTRLVKTLAERDLLVAETNHRVKNALMQASMLLLLGSAEKPHPDVAEAFSAARTRLQTMAGIYDLLSTSDPRAIDLGAFLEALAPRLVPPMMPVEIEARLVPGLMLSPDIAQPLALVAVELVTNAVKHAFPRWRTGKVRVELLTGPESGIALTIADNGVGMRQGTAEALGYKLVRGLVKQVRGALSVNSTADGTTVTVRLPAP